ncbi:hypothetical protein ACOSQ4_024505 [Xanthoceras sorbifolium]
MELDTKKLRENHQTQPVFLSENNDYTKPYMKNEIPLEVPFSNNNKGTYLQDFHHLDHQFHANGSSSSNPHFGVQTPCFEPFDAFPYGGYSSSNFDIYECKPFADNNYNGGHGQVMDNFQSTGGGYNLNHHHHQQHQFSNPGDDHVMMMMHGSDHHHHHHQSQIMPYTFQDMNNKQPVINFVAPDEVSCVNNNNNSNNNVDNGDYYKNKVGNFNKNSSRLHPSTKKTSLKGGKKSSIVKGQWTIDEDRLLIRLVEQYGIRKWSHIAQMLPGRIGKQCRERWHNHLRPDIKKDTWSEEEDKALIEAHAEIGNKWAEIAKRLPGRTENSIKNHWNATKRRQFSKRKCRSKYPRCSLLQDYIKSLNLDSTSSATAAAKQCQQGGRPASSNNTKGGGRAPNQQQAPQVNLEDVCPSSTDRLVPDFDFSDVPDFNFDDKLFQESCSIDSLIDEIPCASIVDEKSLEMDQVPLDDDEAPVLVMESQVKMELDLVEMISQVNLP